MLVLGFFCLIFFFSKLTFVKKIFQENHQCLNQASYSVGPDIGSMLFVKASIRKKKDESLVRQYSNIELISEFLILLATPIKHKLTKHTM